jgi:hypothetical protein
MKRLRVEFLGKGFDAILFHTIGGGGESLAYVQVF